MGSVLWRRRRIYMYIRRRWRRRCRGAERCSGCIGRDCAVTTHLSRRDHASTFAVIAPAACVILNDISNPRYNIININITTSNKIKPLLLRNVNFDKNIDKNVMVNVLNVLRRKKKHCDMRLGLAGPSPGLSESL